MPTDKTVKPLPDHECKYCKTVHVGCCSKACVLKKNPNYPLPSVPTESRQTICKGSFEYDKEAQKYSDVCSLCGIHADQHPEEITLENSARQICASLGILPALPDELAPVMEQLQKFAKHYAASSSEPRIVKIVRTCCAKCHKKISECICPERQGTRCNHPWPCSKEDDSDYDDELGLVESREEHPTVDTILRAKRKL